MVIHLYTVDFYFRAKTRAQCAYSAAVTSGSCARFAMAARGLFIVTTSPRNSSPWSARNAMWTVWFAVPIAEASERKKKTASTCSKRHRIPHTGIEPLALHVPLSKTKVLQEVYCMLNTLWRSSCCLVANNEQIYCTISRISNDRRASAVSTWIFSFTFVPFTRRASWH